MKKLFVVMFVLILCIPGVARAVDGTAWDDGTALTTDTLVDATTFPASSSGAKNKLTWAVLVAKAKAYFDTLYPAILANGETITNADDTEIAFNGTESIAIDLDTGTANEVAVKNRTTGSTGVTKINFSGLSLVTTGYIGGAISVTAVSSLPHSVTTEQAYGGALIVTAAGDVDLIDCDAAQIGANILIVERDASETVSVAVGAAEDEIIYEGASIGANNELDSPGTAGSFAALICMEADKWYVIGHGGTWTDGGTVD